MLSTIADVDDMFEQTIYVGYVPIWETHVYDEKQRAELIRYKKMISEFPYRLEIVDYANTVFRKKELRNIQEVGY